MTSKIYKVIGDNGIYIGSTSLKLEHRFKMHKSNYNCCTTRGLTNIRVELIEETLYKFQYLREIYWLNRTPEAINKQQPRSTPLNICEEYKNYYNEPCEYCRILNPRILL